MGKGKEKEHKEHTWDLIAKKLAGEASPEELKELEALLRDNPELHYPMQTIADIWEHSASHDPKKIEKAFNDHVSRMERVNADYPFPAAVTTASFPRAASLPRPGHVSSIPDGRGEKALSGPTYDELFPAKSNRRKRAFLLAPLAALVLAAVWYLQRPAVPGVQPATVMTNQTPASDASDIYTARGTRSHLNLPDGTTVWLNAGSRIRYEKTFGATSREITLSGEAFFDVAPDPSRPFIIHTRKVNIRVLGTSFDVKSYPTDKTTEATLIRGSIEVSIQNRPENKIILKPNEKLVISNEDSLQTPAASRHKDLQQQPQSLVVISKPTIDEHSGAIIETSWIDDKLIFQEEVFSDLAKQLERKYGVSINFENSRVQQLEFTGIFEKESIRQALDALKLTARFEYIIDGDHITIH